MIILPNGVASVENDVITREANARGIERDLMVVPSILPHIKEGDWVIDAGAAIGDHTHAYLRKVGPTGKVFAFEPSPEFFKCLTHNCPTAICFEKALWDRECDLYIWFEPGNVGGSQLVDRKPNNPKVEWFGPVHSITLDSLNLERVNLIKLDLEGSEMFALNGMRETIKKHRPKLIVEINKAALRTYGLTPKQLHSLINELGYSQKSICNQPGADCEICDVLCLPK